MRAGVLRAEASRGSCQEISTTDAQVVAIAEELSYKCAVTIDAHDIKLLVDLTRRTNVAVDITS